MAKTKKTKAKHQDVQKQKLKVKKQSKFRKGGKLPKGLNETNATFRTRSIQIRDKLNCKSTNEPTTNRKLNLQELLSRCRHYNATVRRDAVLGIRELLSAQPHLLQLDPGFFLKPSFELIVDKEASVRDAVCTLLRFAFVRIPSETMSPFFALLSAHLRCALTHLSSSVQLEGLKILECCVESYPKLMVESVDNQLIETFLEQLASNFGQSSNGHGFVQSVGNLGNVLRRKRLIASVAGKLEKVFKQELERSNTQSDLNCTECKWDSPSVYLHHRLSFAYNIYGQDGLSTHRLTASDPKVLESFVETLSEYENKLAHIRSNANNRTASGHTGKR